MEALIKIKETELGQSVDARELHAFLGVGRDFSTWIKQRIKEYDFVESTDFIIFLETGENIETGRPKKEYTLAIDMAKELSMVERNEKGKQARQYFIACEKEVLRIQQNLSPSEVLLKQVQMLVDVERRQKEQDQKLLELEHKIEENGAKTGFFTVRGYSNLKKYKVNLKDSKELGKKASKLSRKFACQIGKISDEMYGEVNSYKVEVLEEVFNNYFN